MRRSLKQNSIIASQPARFDEVLTEAVLRGVRAKYRKANTASVVVDAKNGGALGTGTEEAPFATLGQAASAIEGLDHVTIVLNPGTYDEGK